MKGVVTDKEFVAAVLPHAKAAVALMREVADPALLAEVVTAQALIETGRRPDGVPTPAGEPPSYNLTGISRADGRVFAYLSLEGWERAEAGALDMSFYREVRAATAAKAMCAALGRSPWASSHYVGASPYDYAGGSLYEVWQELFGASAPSATGPSAERAAPVDEVTMPPNRAVEVFEEAGELHVRAVDVPPAAQPG